MLALYAICIQAVDSEMRAWNEACDQEEFLAEYAANAAGEFPDFDTLRRMEESDRYREQLESEFLLGY
jgi:hypothetical protein